MATDNFCFYLQNGLIQTSQTGGQWYSGTSPFSIPCFFAYAQLRPRPNLQMFVTRYSVCSWQDFPAQCGEKSLCQNKASLDLDVLYFRYLLGELQYLSSDCPFMSILISLYSPHGSSWNFPEYSFGRIPWNLP
jgi:hypothetical protein